MSWNINSTFCKRKSKKAIKSKNVLFRNKYKKPAKFYAQINFILIY